MSRRKVLVVGGGIAGMSFAVAAQRRGIEINVVELERNVLGVGIFLTGSTLRSLDGIGLARQCVREGWPAASLRFFDGAGNYLGESPFPLIASPDLPRATGIPRPKLARILDTAAKEAGVSVRLGLTVDAIEQDENGVDVFFSDGTTGRYHAVVGADGIYSRVRDLVFNTALRPKHASQGGWRFMTPRHPEVDGMMLYNVGDLKAGFVPLDGDWMYLLCTMADPDKIRIGPGEGPALFRRVLEPFTAPLVQEMSERMRTADPATVMWRPFETLLMNDGWSRGRVVLIGDAAHSMTPHLSSGGGMAIEDAVILAGYLSGDMPVAEALCAFYARRIERVRKIQGISMEICKEELLPNPSRNRIYDLTAEGYDALAIDFADPMDLLPLVQES
jgi:2-polyprenyl-6-methoxyphenol hydroxylase-like FAD-dependent oxidoreductase